MANTNATITDPQLSKLLREFYDIDKEAATYTTYKSVTSPGIYAVIMKSTTDMKSYVMVNRCRVDLTEAQRFRLVHHFQAVKNNQVDYEVESNQNCVDAFIASMPERSDTWGIQST